MNLPEIKFNSRLVWVESVKAWLPKPSQPAQMTSNIDAEKAVVRGYEAFQKGLFEEAVKNYSVAIQLNPTNAAFYNARGVCKSKLKLFSSAIKDYMNAIQIDFRSADAYIGLGDAQFNMNLYPEAIENFSEAIQINPYSALAYDNRGACKYALNRYIEAVDDFSKAIALDPKFVDPYYKRGSSKFQLNLYLDAIADYSSVLILDSNYAEAYIYRGLCKQNLKKHDEAIQDFTEAIKIDPQNPWPLVYKGNSFFSIDKFDDAIENFCLAVPLNMGLLANKQSYSSVYELLKFQKISNNLINGLVNNKVWFSHPNKFNDIEDCKYLRHKYPNNKSVQLLINKLLVFSCFGIRLNSQISDYTIQKKMWGDYANSSYGICLHFKFNPDKARNVGSYMFDAVNYSENENLDTNASQYDVIRNGFFTKGVNWEIENEYRFITIAGDKTDIDSNGNFIGQLIGEDDLGLVLSEITFGSVCAEEDIQRVKEALTLRKNGTNIKLYQCILGTGENSGKWTKDKIF